MSVRKQSRNKMSEREKKLYIREKQEISYERNKGEGEIRNKELDRDKEISIKK